MRTEAAHRNGRRPGRVRRAPILLLLALAVPAIAHAQIVVDDDTRVRSIRFEGVHALPKKDLRELIQTRDRGAAYGLRAALGRLPLVPSPAPRYFSPLELQRDVVRLREHYASKGFPQADVRYEVDFDEGKNLLDLRFVIDEGDPVRVGRVSVSGGDSAVAALEPGPRRHWQALVSSVRKLEGRRLEFERIQSGQERLRRWWRDRGHPGADVGARFDTDSTEGHAHVRYLLSPGPFARFGEVTVEGNEALSEASVRRELPFREGDPYSASDIADGRSELQQLEIVRLASFEMAVADSDSLRQIAPGAEIPLRLRIIEAKPRYVSGEVGYVTDAGLSSEARWSHRNFTGGGRTLTVSAAAQSGLLAITDNPDERYRGTVSLLQPYLFDRRISTVLAPYVEHRDDQQDRTLEFGSNATLVFRPAPDRTATLDYRVARKRIYEFRLGSVASGRTDLFTLLVYESQGILDSLGTTRYTSLATLSGTLNLLDRPANPRRGILLRPAVHVTVPPAFSTDAYTQAEGVAYGFVPLASQVVLAARIGGGRIFPFGKSLPNAGASSEIQFLRLRDVLFTAGGSGDVRGWAASQLGPKFPDIRIRQEGDSAYFDADGYVALGGLARMTFSLELRLPFPGLGAHFGTHAFLDGGRIWTPDARYPSSNDFGMERMFYAVGSGVDVLTPVGPIKLSVGYKLNPSILDLADARDVFDALIRGAPVEDVPRHEARRWQFHLSIGSSF